MTHRERMLAAMRGEATDQLPWAPRMDLWYLAQRARGTLPPQWNGMNIAEIARELGVGCRALGADRILPRDPSDLLLRGLGIDNHPDYPFRVALQRLQVECHEDANRQEMRIQTSAGEVSTRIRRTARMAADGISVPFVEKYPVSSIEDLEGVAQVFEDLKVESTPEGYAAFRRRIGEGGPAIANGPPAASPMHLLLHNLMSMEEFYLCYKEQRDLLQQFTRRIEPFFEAILQAMLACNAEVISWGGNYDQDLTWPPFFQEQILPWLQRVSRRAHACGKLVLTHTDGENHDLLMLYRSCSFDVAEAVCPAPMTRSTLAELRVGFGESITVWGGIPCVALLDNSMNAARYQRYMDRLFSELGSGRRLILGVSDNVPPDANMDRLRRVNEWIEQFGPVKV